MANVQSRRGFLAGAAGLSAISGISASARGQVPDAAIAEIEGELTGRLGRVLRPQSPGHAKITYWNARFDCVRSTTYLQPQSREGVAAIVAWANRHGRKLAIRGAGHSFEGRSSSPDIVVDMSRMKRIEFDGRGRLEVEAGVQLGEIYERIGAAGFVIPAGTCPSVGAIGHTLGGGIGDFLPMFGYAAQALREVTFVTLQGTTLRVADDKVDKLAGDGLDISAIQPAAVMKALRGGGQGTLGIITSMVFEAVDLRRAKLASFKLDGASDISRERAAAIIEAWQSWRTVRSPGQMQSRVSSKLNFDRSGNRYSVEIAGLVVVPDEPGPGLDEIRATLRPLFGLREWSQRLFNDLNGVPAAIKTFLDDDQTSYNTKRQKAFGSSSVLTGALPRRALDYFLATVPSDIFVSFYTSGGATKSGRATSLYASEFLMEWVAMRSRLEPQIYRQMRAANLEMMRQAGMGDEAYPNYCDHESRNYFPNRGDLETLRAQLDPGALSTSTLLASPRANTCGS